MTLDVLAVGAHPDDVEVGCGGVLALSTRAGMRVAIADLTGGELGTRGTRELRADEARRAGDILGVQTRITLDLPDGGVGTDPSHRAAVVGLLRELRPRLVLAPYHLDDRHPDHAAAGRLVRDACFLAGVAKWGDGEPHRPARLHHYMLHAVFEPSYVVDVTPVWEQRSAAIAAFESQFSSAPGERRTPIDGGGFLELLDARARVFGAMVGAVRGEPFSVTGPLGLDRLPDLPTAEGPVYRSFL
jgi:bacillithiol biosynthesis deacetylase BshB1